MASFISRETEGFKKDGNPYWNRVGIARSSVFFDESVKWDTSLVVFLREALRVLEKQRTVINFDGLPAGLRKLLELSKGGQSCEEKSEIEDLAENLEEFANDLPNYFVEP